MRRTSFDPGATMSRINVIPIIDVSLVLVVILLITAPVLTVPDVGITLPPAETQGAEDDLRVSVTLGRSGELAVDDKRVSPGAFDAALRGRIAQTRNDVLVVVRADASVPYKDVASVLRWTKEAGAQRIAIATRQGDQVLDGGLARHEDHSPGDASRAEDSR